MSKKKSKKHAKKSKSKPIRKKASTKVRRTNKSTTVKRNKARKRSTKPIAKNRVVSKRKQKQHRKRVNSSRKPTKKARTKRSNKRTNRTVKKTAVTTRRKTHRARTNKKHKKLSSVFIHENFKKDENGFLTPELNNILSIEFDKSLSFADKIFIIQNHSLDAINIMINRHRLLPRSYMVILQTENPKDPTSEPYERANRLSDPTVNPDIPSIRQSMLELVMAFQDNYFEYIFESENPLESDWVYSPENITAIHIRFFYAG